MSEQTLKTSFKITTNQTDLLQITKSISCLVEEATIQINEEGLIFRGMDPSHVALLDVRIPNACFERYEIIQSGSFGFRVDELFKLVRELDKKRSITLQTKDDNTLDLIQGDTVFNIRLIEASSTDTPLPKIPYDARIDPSLREFNKTLKRISAVSDYVTIKTTDSYVEFSGKGDNGTMKNKLEKEHPDLLDLIVKQNSESTYSLEYLMPFIKSLDNSASLSLEYSTAKPIRLETKVSNIGTIHYYLAPRVED